MTTHYHILNNQCDPDTLPTYDTLTEARRAIVEEANVFRHDLQCHVTGSARDGYTIQWDKESYGFWRVYVAPCTESACMTEDL